MFTEVSNQMLELYEQTRVPPSHGSEVEGSTTGGAAHQNSSKSVSENSHATTGSNSQAKDMANKSTVLKASLSRPADNHPGPSRTSQIQGSDYRSSEEGKAKQHHLEAVRRKAALESQRKSHADINRKPDLIDRDDPIEREREAGVELAAKEERSRQDTRQSHSMTSEKLNLKNSFRGNHPQDARDAQQWRREGKRQDMDNIEEGELSDLDDGQGPLSPKMMDNRKRKIESPPTKLPDGKKWHGLDS